MKFDIDIFNAKMKEYDSEKLVTNNWGIKKGTNNLMMEYTYNPEPMNASLLENFRTWEQESSSPNIKVADTETGLIVTCKIDYVRPDKQLDDHIILMTGFLPKGNTPTLCFAQVLVEFTANENLNFNTEAITNQTVEKGSDITSTLIKILTKYCNLLPNSIKSQSEIGQMVDAPKGWKYFPDIVKANIECMAESIY
ncbi:hypothetical protein VB796_18600 [Arcicella sp. LKC2W]|uniref:hypothetical protein n=1 Tax=Arcicella sp. LKC2W TaxID=2984198 RepID=UPI002B21C872|nr:hypothetical protein [Arcicella sp. LKC2W]MEA5461079.1 hypothetical protein [Arcicella sp. LKC2W]